MRCVAIGSSADAGSSISRISGLTASARAMHSRCCWPPDSASAESCSRSLTSSQIAAALQALLDPAVQLGSRRRQAVQAEAVGDVLEDRLRKRVRLLEHHADAAAQRHDVGPRRRRCRRRRSGPGLRRACPAMMSFIRFSVRRNVLLPQPDGPMNAVTRLRWMPMEMSSSARLVAVVEIQARGRRSRPDARASERRSAAEP